MMRLLKLLIFIACLAGFSITAFSQTATDSLLTELNAVLAKKDQYVKQKQQEITQLNQKLLRAGTAQQQ